jgi:hypothetical protein
LISNTPSSAAPRNTSSVTWRSAAATGCIGSDISSERVEWFISRFASQESEKQLNNRKKDFSAIVAKIALKPECVAAWRSFTLE